MSEKYAVVDLETTGPNPQRDKIIQIGIVLIDDGQITDQFAQDINPECILPVHIANLTGITDSQLRSAPLFEEVAPLIYALIQNRTFIAHNINFDYQFLKYHFAQSKIDFNEKGMDTVELTQILYPTLESYRLEDIAKVFELEHSNSHQADSDAYATAALYLKLTEKVQQLPKYLLGQLSDLSGELSYQTGAFFQKAYLRSNLSQHSYVAVNGLLLKKMVVSQAKIKRSPLILAEVLKRFGMTKRPIQVEMIEYLTEKKGLPNFIEAPSGIGKTFAYLFGILNRIGKNQRLVVSTETKLLQSQLVDEELPKIAEIFGIQGTLLKSKRNYLDLTALKKNLKTATGKRTSIYQMGVLIWLLETETGDLDELNNLDLTHAFFEAVRYANHSLANQFGEYDFYQRITEQVRQSTVLITNHAYLLERLKQEPTLFSNDILLIDEAHQWLKTIEQIQEKKINLTGLIKRLEQEAFEKDSELQFRIIDILKATVDELMGNEATYFDDDWFIENSELVEALTIYLNDLLSVGTEYIEEIELLLAYFQPNQIEKVKWVADTAPFVLAENSLNVSKVNEYLAVFSEQIFISATLSFNGTTDFFPKLLGIQQYEFVRFDSTIYRNQQLWVAEDSPDILNLSTKEYSRYICQVIDKLIDLKRPILVLFTSQELLKQTYYHLENQLKNTIFAQGITGSNSRILKRFRYADEAILLATSSFWEGVDFPEFEKSILVITRLPFEQPENPFVKRMTLVQEQLFKNAFRDYTLPLATLKLRQAFGRNLRHQAQKSAIVMLDKRLITKSYGKRIINNLPTDLTIEQADLEKIPSQITAFFKES
ncbi:MULTISPECIES: helicase C-terminal domain-containing protein [unclassified Enterococcus]|uniref:helicase C-terminal domain-containing protein n=1 Tax=unclassified Enterococcus TaxID=2608891 RepID=UPI00155641A2|nr:MULTISPECIES: helicase C-terminal domain-containing protein [unclassified Enterococcus]MBS7577169.1 ribonuclease H-like domain-containing protein [Enterococcus sp. MMGLQ5-2]MBS7584738.1 ribonuclease H-like domain-containing protein [Enterococcus sp. MMGLQ5-1]NPD12593.1 hypothetical protein [Enterococcus sp. MMGLQ5-1]NPD37003.1 hypothetical protein [Enterococcus sp. MMGLQ5-2]